MAKFGTIIDHGRGIFIDVLIDDDERKPQQSDVSPLWSADSLPVLYENTVFFHPCPFSLPSTREVMQSCCFFACLFF